MSEVGTNTELLVTCLHDMADGEEQLADRLGAIAGHVTEKRLSEAFGGILERAAHFARRFHEAATALEAPEPDADNIWMRGILDDAERDTETIARGRLLDIALVGAIRKALASEIVSYETAVAVARVEDTGDLADRLAEARDDRQSADRGLAGLLEELAAGAD